MIRPGNPDDSYFGGGGVTPQVSPLGAKYIIYILPHSHYIDAHGHIWTSSVAYIVLAYMHGSETLLIPILTRT